MMIRQEVIGMKIMKIRWQRLINDEQTCPRCGSTEKEIDKAVAILKEALRPVGIRVVNEKGELSATEFQEDPLQSNRIWVNGRPLEDWVDGTTGQSQCCSVCGTADCRTVGVGGEVYETIPADLVIRAGLIAAAALLGPAADKRKTVKKPSRTCCPK
jgi:anti-sigma factor RsiW